MSRRNIIVITSFVVLTGAIGVILFNRRQRIRRVTNLLDGISETSPNKKFSDATWEQWLKDVGWKSGEQWCMYYSKRVLMEAFKKDAEAINKALGGSTQSSYNLVKSGASPLFEISQSPKVGDIAIWQRTTNPAFGHAGVVRRVYRDGTMEVSEGNVTIDKAIEGVGKFNHDSKIGSKHSSGSTLALRGFIRYKG